MDSGEPLFRDSNMKHKTLTIGILPLAAYQARTLAIVRGELKPTAKDPKVFFPSFQALAQLLSEENRQLLQVILETNPASITELAQTTGRAQSNLTRTLKRLANVGIVSFQEINRKRKPVVEYTDFAVRFGLQSFQPGA